MQIKNSNIIKSIKRLTAAAVALSLIFFTISPSLRVSAEETWPGDVAIQGPSAVVMDIDSGTVLYDKGGEDQHYPASITKIMTGLLAVEHGNLKDTVTFSDKAIDNVRNDSSNIARDVGEKMTLEECLYGMFLASANECAWAIAEHIGGSEPKFIDMMNEKAKELGCTHTHFANPNGLHMDDHYTCASDMAKIACAAYKNPEIAKIVGTKSYQIPPTNKHTDVTPLHNSHSMLCANRTSRYIYKPCVGGKTGFTDQAKHTLITFAKKNGLSLACVVMYEDSKPAMYGDTETLLEYCFNNFTSSRIRDNVNLNSNGDTGALGRKIKVLEIGDGNVILPKGVDIKDVSYKVKGADRKNNKAGRIVYSYAGREVGKADLIYAENKSDIYPFHNIPEKDGGSSIKYIRIDGFRIAAVVIVIILIVLAVDAIRKMRRAFMKRHVRRSRKPKKEKSEYKIIRKKRKTKAERFLDDLRGK